MTDLIFVSEKLSLDQPPHLLVLFHSLQDFFSIAFKDLLSAIIVHLESHYIASKSFQTFHTSPTDFDEKTPNVTDWF